jgi:hypothetical protein
MRTTIVFFRHISAHCVKPGHRATQRESAGPFRPFKPFRRRSPSCSPSRGSCSHISMFMIHPQERSYSSGRIVCRSHTPRWKGRAPGEYSRSLLLSRVSRQQMRPSLRMRVTGGNDARLSAGLRSRRADDSVLRMSDVCKPKHRRYVGATPERHEQTELVERTERA